MKDGNFFPSIPLAYRLRPESFDEFIGQERITSKDSILLTSIESGNIPSMILYGPPGSGKTTLAYLIARSLNADFYQISAVDSGVKDVRKIIDKAEAAKSGGKKSILFIDEIHRFNKAQQDALLPAVESGTITLIGATTENPFLEIIRPLISRCLILVLEPLSDSHLRKILERALKHEKGLQGRFEIEEEALERIIKQSNGDARRALNILEGAARIAYGQKRSLITSADIEKVLEITAFYYDKGGDYHYDFASAFIKSMRASDPDAALVYMLRMIEAGEDPKFIARRMVIFASEDIGNADPLALLIAVAAFEAVEKVGLPECAINLSHAAIYLSLAPKSNASYLAYKKVIEDLKKKPEITVPRKLRDSHYPGASFLGHGKGYRYPHDYEGHFYPESLLPEELKGKIYYSPTDQGFEKKLKERLERLREMVRKKGSET